jgi:3-oxoacyl-[acyl-carrier protein] reductase
MKCVAKTVAPFNATSNSIAPGLVKTNMSTQVVYPANVLDGQLIKQWGEPKDIAAAALYLASDAAKFVTGATLDVNGGSYIR